MIYTVQLEIDVEAKSPEDAKRLIEPLVVPGPPFIVSVEMDCYHNCRRCEDTGTHQEWGSRGEAGEVFCRCELGRQMLKAQQDRDHAKAREFVKNGARHE